MIVDLLLINPNAPNPSPFRAVEPPLWAGLIADYHISKGETVNILDAEALNLTPLTVFKEYERLQPEETIVVCMGNNPTVSSTPKMRASEELLKWIPKAKITGLHPISVNYPGVIKKPFTGTPNIPWSMYDLSQYKAHNWHCLEDVDNRSPYGVTYTSLNCGFNCYYCNVHTLYGDRIVRYRPVENVYKDFDCFASRGVRHIKIWDELFCLKKDRVHQICNYIIKQDYKFNIWAYARLDTVDENILSKMKRAGINWVAYGFESVNDPKMAKRTEDVIRWTKEAGISIIANFMFGLPGETLEIMQASYNFAVAHNFEWINYYVALPYPGSAWYDSLKDKPDDWTRFGQYSTSMYGEPEVIKFKNEKFKEYMMRADYLAMINKKFGEKAVRHISDVVKWNMK